MSDTLQVLPPGARTRTLWSALSEADQDALFNGVWLIELATSPEGPSTLQVMTSNVAIAEPATIGIPRCVNSDHTINALSDNVDVIDEYGWRAVTSWFLSNVPISVGDILTPEPGVSVTGDYGKLKKAVVGEIGVAVAVAIGSGWLQYLAIEPRIVGGPLPRLHASTHHSGGSDELRLDQLAAPVGSLDMNKQQAVSLCVENRTSDPSSPGIGQIWLRTDL